MPETPARVPHYFAVGVPKGLVVGPETGERGSFFSSGGEIVDSLSAQEYALWLVLLQPRSRPELIEVGRELFDRDPSAELETLLQNNFVASMQPGERLTGFTAGLRAIPRGMGLGNLTDPLTFEIGPAPGATTLTVGVFGMAVWLYLDGVRSLRDATILAAEQSNESATEMEAVTTELVLAAMTRGLLFLDRPRASVAR